MNGPAGYFNARLKAFKATLTPGSVNQVLYPYPGSLTFTRGPSFPARAMISRETPVSFSPSPSKKNGATTLVIVP